MTTTARSTSSPSPGTARRSVWRFPRPRSHESISTETRRNLRSPMSGAYNHHDAAALNGSGEGVKRARILVVDDEPDMVANCRRILERAGHECLAADDGARGLEVLEAE